MEEAAERADHIEGVKALGLWVTIPRGMSQVRESAKKLGCLFDGDRKQWAAPTAEARAQVERLVVEHRAAKRAERQQADREIAELQAQIAQERGTRPAQEVSAQVLAERAGRRATGEMATFHWVSTAYMRGGQARSMLRKVGEVITLDDGRRGVVVEAKVWFTDDEMASSVCWHDEIDPGAHWDLWHRVAVVADTEAEAAERRERQEREREASELHSLMNLPAAGPVQEGTHVVAERDRVGRIECRYGTGHTLHDGGVLTLTRDGRVVGTHPGWYDDYRSTWWECRDEALVERVRAAVEGGARERVFVDQMAYVYTVTLAG